MEIVVWIILTFVTAVVAGHRGRCAFCWLILGFLLPILSLIIVLVLPKTKRQRRADLARDLLETRELRNLDTEDLRRVESGWNPRKQKVDKSKNPWATK